MIRPIENLDAYKYVVSDIKLMSPDFDEPIVITSTEFITLSIYRDYDKNVIPSLFLTANLKRSYYEQVMTSIQKLTASFTIYRTVYTDDGSEIDYDHPYITNTFKVSNSDLLDTRVANKMKNTVTDTYNTTQESIQVNFNLYDYKSLEKAKKHSSYILNGTMNDILFNIFKDRGFNNVLMTSITSAETKDFMLEYGTMMDNFKSLDNYYGIYDTPYLFFIDFNETYFIDKKKLGKTLKTNELGIVNMYLEKTEDSRSLNNGCYIDLVNGYYILNALPFQVNDSDTLIDFYTAGKVTTSVVGSKTTNSAVIGDYNIERAYSINNEKQRNQILYDIQESKRSITLEFTDIDIDIMTPNKKFYLIPDTFYDSKYNVKGEYRLVSTNTFIVRNTESLMKCIIQCTFKKVKDL